MSTRVVYEKGPAALIVPLDGDHVWLVEQCAPHAWSTWAGCTSPTGSPIGGVDLWLATGLEPRPRDLETTEHGLRVGRSGVAELEAMIARGEVADAASVAAWHRVAR